MLRDSESLQAWTRVEFSQAPSSSHSAAQPQSTCSLSQI